LEADLASRIEKLDEPQRVAFAAACCERVFPAYETFSKDVNWGDVGHLREALDLAWGSPVGEPSDEQKVRQLLECCNGVVPDLDNRFDSDFAAPAQNAAIAVMRTLESTRDGSAERAARVGDLALDAVEAYVDLAFGEGALYDAVAVERNPAVEAERRDQEDSLERLEKSTLDASLLDGLRLQARRSGFWVIEPSA